MSSSFDFTPFDRPEVLGLIFYPRPDYGFSPDGAVDLKIPVAEGVSVGARFFRAGTSCPTILFFHGNGEIVSDYDDIGLVYVKMNINFMAVDYRGYGASSGIPSVSSMMNEDCYAVFDFTRNYLESGGYEGPLIVMGRSLGSAPGPGTGFGLRPVS